jgi:hypothetical protein
MARHPWRGSFWLTKLKEQAIAYSGLLTGGMEEGRISRHNIIYARIDAHVADFYFEVVGPSARERIKDRVPADVQHSFPGSDRRRPAQRPYLEPARALRAVAGEPGGLDLPGR